MKDTDTELGAAVTSTDPGGTYNVCRNWYGLQRQFEAAYRRWLERRGLRSPSFNPPGAWVKKRIAEGTDRG